jgi:hypothetical protein
MTSILKLTAKQKDPYFKSVRLIEEKIKIINIAIVIEKAD